MVQNRCGPVLGESGRRRPPSRSSWPSIASRRRRYRPPPCRSLPGRRPPACALVQPASQCHAPAAPGDRRPLPSFSTWLVRCDNRCARLQFFPVLQQCKNIPADTRLLSTLVFTNNRRTLNNDRSVLRHAR